MITIITGPAASGKSMLAKKLAKDKRAFKWVQPIDFPFVKVPKDCEVIIFDGLTSRDFYKIKSFAAQKKIIVNVQASDGYEINLPDLIIVFDQCNTQQLDYWKDKGAIICLNPKSNEDAVNS